MKTNYLYLILLCFFTLFSCQKWYENQQNFEFVLTNGRWQTTKSTERPNPDHPFNPLSVKRYPTTNKVYFLFTNEKKIYHISEDDNYTTHPDSCFFIDDIYNNAILCSEHDLRWDSRDDKLILLPPKNLSYYFNDYSERDSSDLMTEYNIVKFSDNKIILERKYYYRVYNLLIDSLGNKIDASDTIALITERWELKNIK